MKIPRFIPMHTILFESFHRLHLSPLPTVNPHVFYSYASFLYQSTNIIPLQLIFLSSSLLPPHRNCLNSEQIHALCFHLSIDIISHQCTVFFHKVIKMELELRRQHNRQSKLSTYKSHIDNKIEEFKIREF